MRRKITRKSLLGNRARKVAIMAITMDIAVTRAAYNSPHDNLLYSKKMLNHIHNNMQKEQVLQDNFHTKETQINGHWST